MTQLLLIRHAVNDFVKTGKLAGWTPGVHLNEEGLAQAEALGQRLSRAPIERICSSPLERTMETAEAIRKHHPHLTIEEHSGIGEVNYGDWEGMLISDLRHRKMWEVVQEYPSRAYFPNGETMREVQMRVVNAIEEMVRQNPRAMIAAVLHADLIKMAVAHYLGMHLDNFQRIVISPASISALSLGHSRPFVATVNDVAHVLELEQRRRQSEAAAATEH